MLITNGIIQITCNCALDSEEQFAFSILPDGSEYEDHEATTSELPYEHTPTEEVDYVPTHVSGLPLEFGPISGAGNLTGAREQIAARLRVPPPSAALLSDEEGDTWGDVEDDKEVESLWPALETVGRITSDCLNQVHTIDGTHSVNLHRSALLPSGPALANQRCLEIHPGRDGEFTAEKYLITLEGDDLMLWEVAPGKLTKKKTVIAPIELGEEHMGAFPCPTPGLAVANCNSEILILKDDSAPEDAAWLCTLKVIDPYVAYEIRRIVHQEERAKHVLYRATILDELLGKAIQAYLRFQAWQARRAAARTQPEPPEKN